MYGFKVRGIHMGASVKLTLFPDHVLRFWFACYRHHFH